MPDIDGRAHKSLVSKLDSDWLGDLLPEQVPIVNSLLSDADEWGDLDLQEYTMRFVRLRTSVHANRAKLMAGVASRDQDLEAPRDENIAPPKPRGTPEPREPKAPPEPKRF